MMRIRNIFVTGASLAKLPIGARQISRALCKAETKK